MKRIALVVVDVQRDFCPGGALAVKQGDKIIPRLNKVISLFLNHSYPIFFTRDWHPPNHCSFKQNGGIWPPHCVQGTEGAMFHPMLFVPENSYIISKATRPDLEAYSGFQHTELEKRLRELQVAALVVGGLATDYCVKNTVIDGLNLGFNVYLLQDCIKGVNLKPGDSRRAIEEMKKKGANIIISKSVGNILGT